MNNAAHVNHGWVQQSTDHIRNVPYLLTHDLMKCPCGWYGWHPKALGGNP